MMEEEAMQRCNDSWLTRGYILPNGSRTSHDGDDFVRALGVSIGIFDISLGSFGNFLTILAIWRNKRLRSTFHSFIVSLCFVDFCTATFMMPFNVVSYATAEWPFGKESITCSIQAFVYYCCGYSSVVCLLVITTNRFIGVLYPDKYEDIFTPTTVSVIIAVSLAFAPIVMGVFFFIGPDGKPGYGWIDKYSLCVFRTDKHNESIMRYMMFTRILFQLMPLVIMIAMYSKIYYTVWKSGRDVAKLSLRSAERRCSENLCKDHEDTTAISVYPPTSHMDESLSQSEDSLDELKPDTAAQTLNSKDCHYEGSDVSDSDNNTGTKFISKASTTCSSSNFTKQPRQNAQAKFERNQSHTRSFSIKRKNRERRGFRGFSSRVRTSRKSVGSARSRSSMIDTIRKRRKTDKRLLSISVTICLVFTIIFYPSMLVNLLPCSQFFNPNVHRCASIITWFNSCVNPVIYCFMNPKLRAEYKVLLRSFGSLFLRLIGKCARDDDCDRAVPGYRS